MQNTSTKKSSDEGAYNHKLIIDGQPYNWEKDIITGLELRKLGNVPNDSALYYKIQGKDAEVHDTETIDLGRIGTEKFYSIPNDPVYKFTVNGEKYSWNARYITGEQIKSLNSIDNNHDLYLKEENEDSQIFDDTRVDLAPIGKEGFYSKEKDKQVEITVRVSGNEKKIKLNKGKYKVLELREMAEVPDAYVFEQIIDGNIIPLNDLNSIVKIKGGEIFIAHVSDGSSS